MFGSIVAGLLVFTSVLLARRAVEEMFAGYVDLASGSGSPIAQSAVRSRTKGPRGTYLQKHH